MKIWKDTLAQLAGEGRLTLQVPEIVIGHPLPGEEDVPADWFIRARVSGGGKYELCVGKESGFLFLSRKGWEANKDRVKAAFDKAKHKRGTWVEFEKHAADFFDGLEETRQKRIRAAQEKIAQLKAGTI